jgi:sigma-E factor negative regulatory protein RseB
MRPPRAIARWCALGLLCGSFMPLAAAALPDAAGWLGKLNVAAHQTSYRGTMAFSVNGGVVSSSRIAHLSIGDQIYERVEALDGQMHRVYRHNETVHSVWPHKKVVVVEQHAAAPGLVATRRRVDPRVLESYALTVKGASVVAGRTVRMLLLEPRDDLRFTQRLMADEATGLMLRADVLDAAGRVLESSGFTEVEIGLKLEPAAMRDGMKPAGYAVLPSSRQAVDWAGEGWGLKAEIPGFRLVGCVRRPVPAQGRDGHALQAVYSDGLSFVSIFIEPWRGQESGDGAMGATHTRMQRLGDHWITAMGDVPPRTLEHFLAALERRR